MFYFVYVIKNVFKCTVYLTCQEMSSGGFAWTVCGVSLDLIVVLIWNVVVWCMFPRFGIKRYRGSSCKNELSVISYSPSCHMICFILWKAKKDALKSVWKTLLSDQWKSQTTLNRNTENSGTFFKHIHLAKAKCPENKHESTMLLMAFFLKVCFNHLKVWGQ